MSTSHGTVYYMLERLAKSRRLRRLGIARRADGCQEMPCPLQRGAGSVPTCRSYCSGLYLPFSLPLWKGVIAFLSTLSRDLCVIVSMCEYYYWINDLAWSIRCKLSMQTHGL